MESDDSMPVLTDIEFDFPTFTPSTLGQPLEPVVTFLLPPSRTIPSKPASPYAQSNTVTTAQELISITVCTIPTVTTDQLDPPTILSSVRDARAKSSSSRTARDRLKRRFHRMQ